MHIGDHHISRILNVLDNVLDPGTIKNNRGGFYFESLIFNNFLILKVIDLHGNMAACNYNF